MLELMYEPNAKAVEVASAANDHAVRSDISSEQPGEGATPFPDGPTFASAPSDHAPPALTSTLEDRVRQLEDQVVGLQDTRKLEDRLTERVARRLERKQANTAIKVPTAAIAEPTKPPPLAAVAPPPDLAPVVVLEGKTGRQPWLFLDIFSEFQAMLRMFFDLRYRVFYMKWQTKVYPAILLGLIILSGLTISYIPLVGPVLDRIVELIIAFSLYKVLSRETYRYKEIEPQIRR
jgi:hypothetical protein